MLMALRERVMGILGWLLLGALFIAFAFFGLNSYFTSSVKTYAAKVNGTEISVPEYQRAYERLRERMQELMGKAFNPAMINEAALKKQALQKLIRQQLLLQEAHADGYAVSKQLVAAQINAVPAFKGADGKFSVDKYRSVLRMQGMAPAEFEWRLSREIMVNQVVNGVLQTAGISQKNLENIYRLQAQQRRFSYLDLPLARYAKRVQVSDADIKTYYAAHGSEFMRPERVKIRYVELKAADLKVPDQPSDKELRALYDEHKDRYMTPERRRARHILISVAPDAGKDAVKKARAKAEGILARLKKGESFAKLAKKDSDDPGSAAKGGDLGYFTRGEMTPAFDAAAFSLKKDELSGIVKTRFGFHIIEVTDIKPAVTKPFDAVRDSLVKEYRAQQRNKLFSQKSDVLANTAFEQPDTLKGVADALGLEIKISDWLTRTGGPGIGRQEAVVKAAFGDDVLETGDNSEPVSVGDDDQVVLRILNHETAATQPLDAVREEVAAAVRNMKARELASSEGDSLLKELRSGTSLAQIAKAQGIKVNTTGMIGRNAGAPARTIVDQAFLLAPPAGKSVSAAGFALDSGDYILLRLDDVKDGNFSALSAADQAKTREELDRIRGSAELTAYIEDLKKRATIRIPQQSD